MRHSDASGTACGRRSVDGIGRYAPRVKHIVAPRIQHHVTEEGPPTSRGVLKVVATLEQRPMMLNAKLIWGRTSVAGSQMRWMQARTVAMLENSRLKEGT